MDNLNSLKNREKVDIRTLKKFKRYDYNYTCVKADVENNIYVYKMEHIEEPIPYSQYEVVVGVKAKQPDGSTVYVYPSSSQFGVNGWYICGNEEVCQEKINEKVCDILEKRGE